MVGNNDSGNLVVLVVMIPPRVPLSMTTPLFRFRLDVVIDGDIEMPPLVDNVVGIDPDDVICDDGEKAEEGE